MSLFFLGLVVGLVGALASITIWANASALAEANGESDSTEASK